MQSASPNTSVGRTSPIARDIQNVVTDAQELLKTVQSEGESKFADVKTKVQGQLDVAKQKLGELQASAQESARAAMDSTDAYVRSNPWRAVGISAALGALIGILIARR